MRTIQVGQASARRGGVNTQGCLPIHVCAYAGLKSCKAFWESTRGVFVPPPPPPARRRLFPPALYLGCPREPVF